MGLTRQGRTDTLTLTDIIGYAACAEELASKRIAIGCHYQKGETLHDRDEEPKEEKP